MKSFLKVNGVWRDLNKVQFNKNGTWYKPRKLWIKLGGVWTQMLDALAPTFARVGDDGFLDSTSIEWRSDGSVDAGENSPWLNSVAAGNGNGFWIRIPSHVGVSCNRGPQNTWYQMSSALRLSRAAGQYFINGTYQVSSDGGATILGSGTWYLAGEL